MSDLLLTDAERDRFATYLEREAATDDSMAKQAATIPGMDPVVKRYRMMAAAKMIVAQQLRNIEVQTIGGSDAE